MSGRPARAPRLVLDLPLVDHPDNAADGYTAPSMQQSLALTRDFYQTSHYLIEKVSGRNVRLLGLSTVAFDVLAVYLPLGDGWLHEEWHRAILRNRGIDSVNDIYKFRLLAETVAVSHVTDADLIRLKRAHPADHVRLMEAGIEGEYQLALGLEKDRFFSNTAPRHTLLYWLSYVNSILYVGSTAKEVNELTDDANRQDGANVEVRDFAGHDFTAWVYDLHRPDEAYEARGVHPSGVGIDRYIRYSDLTPEEQNFLKLQRILAYLNLLDSNLIGISGFMVTSPLNGQPMTFNMTARHLLTSFGFTMDVNVFMKQDPINLFVILHHYVNGERYFPGVEVELLDYPLRLRGRVLGLSARLGAWLQPERQRFQSRSAAPGGLAALKVYAAVSSRYRPYVEVEGKTAGWVTGNVHLDSNVSVRLGVSVVL